MGWRLTLPPQRPQRHPTLHLHDLDEHFTPAGADAGERERGARRWADTPGAAAVAAWVREQQIQAQYQFAPLSSPPSPPAPAEKAHPSSGSGSGSGFLGKVKKLMKK